MICLNLHFAVVNFLNLTLEVVESNPGRGRFSFSSDYSDSVGSNSSTSSAGLRNFAIKKSIQAFHHQSHLKYIEFQQECNALAMLISRLHILLLKSQVSGNHGT